MKELTIKEKAKRYDEAKYIMKEYLESGNAGVIAENTIKKAFPELAESEDERIRKWLIYYFKEVCDNVSEKEKKGILAWLEKQSETVEINPTEFDLHLNKLLKQFETLPKEELVNCLSFYLNVVQNDGTYRSLRSKWKPSDAQMASITCAVRKMKESACYDSELVSLYQDLKKL